MAGIVPLAGANTVYVRDTLYVPLRAGQSQAYRIIHNGLKSGTPLQLLESNAATGYSKVQMQNGQVGWIETQYLEDQPIAKAQLKTANDKLTQLEAQHQQTMQNVQNLQSQRESLSKELNDTRIKFDQMRKRLAHIQNMSANVVKIDQRNSQLQANEAQLKAQIQQLTDSNHKLQDTSNQTWFLRGGALVFVALLMGFLVGRRVYNRRNSGWA